MKTFSSNLSFKELCGYGMPISTMFTNGILKADESGTTKIQAPDNAMYNGTSFKTLVAFGLVTEGESEFVFTMRNVTIPHDPPYVLLEDFPKDEYFDSEGKATKEYLLVNISGVDNFADPPKSFNYEGKLTPSYNRLAYIFENDEVTPIVTTNLVDFDITGVALMSPRY